MLHIAFSHCTLDNIRAASRARRLLRHHTLGTKSAASRACILIRHHTLGSMYAAFRARRMLRHHTLCKMCAASRACILLRHHTLCKMCAAFRACIKSRRHTLCNMCAASRARRSPYRHSLCNNNAPFRARISCEPYFSKSPEYNLGLRTFLSRTTNTKKCVFLQTLAANIYKRASKTKKFECKKTSFFFGFISSVIFHQQQGRRNKDGRQTIETRLFSKPPRTPKGACR